MMGEQQNELRKVFLEARALATPAERARYLDTACRDNPDLRQRVEALLRAAEQSGEFLKEDALGRDLDPPESFITEAPGTVIGHYKLLEQIGEGGFGVVFMAEQVKPIRRKVALKIVKPGMDTKQVIARFEAERQALALMNHPNIAQVFDAGSTDTGRPYFVMELVQGVPITQFCDANKLTPHERLKLFQQVCEAIQHAHQKGIIHRDLKPSNILVTLHDGKPVPKVIDFGTAKALQQPLTEKTLFTAYGKLIGTPQYMSPEQAELSGLDIDTRADIYGLGVLLYELLTGTTPFEAERLRTAAFEEMMHIIREEEPPKPSTRISTLGERATEIAKHRQVDAALLRRTLQGDLDWIVMKALEKDRSRRYETANALWQDLQHHLNHEPVRAGPPGAAYRARKFIRRNRISVAVAAAVTCALTVGLTASLIGFAQARRERDRAIAAEAKAGEEADIAEAVNQFLQQDLLGQASPFEQPDRDVKLRFLLDQAAVKVGSRFKEKPLVEAELHITLSEVYRSLGEYTNAQRHLDRGLEIYQERLSPDDPRFLRARRNEANLLRDLDHQAESQTLLEHLLPVHRRVLGPEHRDTLKVMRNLATTYELRGFLVKAQQLAEEALSASRRVLGPEHLDTLGNMLDVASIYDKQGKVLEAQDLEKQVLAISRRTLGEEHFVTLRAGHNLAITYLEDDPAETQKLLEELLPVARRVLGPENPITTFYLMNLAEVYRRSDKAAQAQELEEEALRVQRRELNLEHRDTLKIMFNLGVTYQVQRKFTEAQKLFETVLTLRRKTFGVEHEVTLDTMARLAGSYRQQDMPLKAQALDEELVTMRRRVLGAEHPDTLMSMLDLAGTHADLDNATKAQELVESALAISRRALGEEHEVTLKAKYIMAKLYLQLGKPAEAQEQFEAVLPAIRRVFGNESPETISLMHDLAVAYIRQRKLAEARKLGEEVLAIQRRKLGPDHPDTLLTLYNLAIAYGTEGNLTEAQKLHEESLAGRRRTLGPEHPQTLESMLQLASILSQQGKRVESRTLYEEAIAGQQHALGPQHPDTIYNMNNLAWLLATCADAKVRDGETALRLAKEVVAATGRTNDSYLDTLAAAYAEVGQFTNAVRAQQEAIVMLTHTEGWRAAFNARVKLYEAGHPFRENDKQLVKLLRLDGRLAELEIVQREQLPIRRANDGDEHESVADSLSDLTFTLLGEQKFADAESPARECLVLREKLTPNAWQTSDARCLLGASLLGQKKYDEAEPLLVAGCDGLQQREAQISPADKPRLREAIRNLATLYEATARPERATAVTRKLADLEKQEASLIAIRDALQRGKEASQAQRWPEAAGSFRKALAAPYFTWSAAESELPDAWNWVGVAFAHAGTADDHRLLYRTLAAAPTQFPSPADAARKIAKVCVLPARPEPEMLILASNLLARAEPVSTNAMNKCWFELARGLFHYRTGRNSDALECFRQAAGSTTIYCQATAVLLQAMAAKHLGQDRDAEQLYRQAKAMLPELNAQRESAGRIPNILIFELIQDEAELLLSSPAPPTPTP